MRSRVAAIALCLILTVPVGLAVLGLHQMRERVRYEVKEMLVEGLDRTELVRIALTTRDSARLDWEHAREFRRGGAMYDVVEREHQGDTTVYWCWHDHAETAVVQQLETLLVGGLRHEREAHRTTEHIVRLLTSLWTARVEVRLPGPLQGAVCPDVPVHLPASHSTAPPVPPPDGMA